MELLITTLCVAMVFLLAVDMEQTFVIAKSPTFRELNPILGSKPSEQKITWYFVLVYILLGIAVFVFYEKHSLWTVAGLFMAVLIEGYVVYRNHRIGIKIYKNW